MKKINDNIVNVSQKLIDLATGLPGEFVFKDIRYESQYSTKLIFCKKNEELDLEDQFYKLSLTSTDKWNSIFLISLEHVKIISIDKWPYKGYSGIYQEIKNFDKVIDVLSELNYTFTDNIINSYNKVLNKQNKLYDTSKENSKIPKH